MTSHGFGKTTIKSLPTTFEDLEKFAMAITDCPGVYRVHVVRPNGGKAFILFQFDHMYKYENNEGFAARPEDILENFAEINDDPPVAGHSIDIDATEFWIIEVTYP